jgi:uncharacterized phage infection (PIP) family protein YhgE
MEALRQMANDNLRTTRPHFFPVGEKVKLVGPQVTAKPSGQPTIQDVLNAIQGLSNMISQLSKNQQIMESWLSNSSSQQQYQTSCVSGFSDAADEIKDCREMLSQILQNTRNNFQKTQFTR